MAAQSSPPSQPRGGDGSPSAPVEPSPPLDPGTFSSPAPEDAESLDRLLALYNMAKIGLHKAKWRPAPKMVAAYRAVRTQLQDAGRLPK